LAAFSPTETGSDLVLYAATPGAFIDLAADLNYALGLHPAALTLDDDLTEPVSGTGITGLTSQSTINQALGVLIDRGHTPEAARQELNRLAALDSGQLHHAADAILRSTTRPPNNGDPDDVASGCSTPTPLGPHGVHGYHPASPPPAACTPMTRPSAATKGATTMSDPPVSRRLEGEPRLDVHNSNVDEDSAETGRCGTLDLRSGRVCRLPALHPDACDFQAPPDAAE
jgi:hypothetical protein